MKKLHLICGMCGCDGELTFEISPNGKDIDGKLEPAVHISCDNCSTLTSLDGHINQTYNPTQE